MLIFYFCYCNFEAVIFFLGNWETVFTCLYPFTVQTRPLAGTASGMASDSVRSRGKTLLGPIWNLRPMGGRDFTESYHFIMTWSSPEVRSGQSV